MTASAAPAVALDDLLGAYKEHVEAWALDPMGRLRSARRFLAHHPDLRAWLARPTPARVADLHRDKAWPLIVWAAVSGRLRADAELLLAKPGGVDLSPV